MKASKHWSEQSLSPMRSVISNFSSGKAPLIASFDFAADALFTSSYGNRSTARRARRRPKPFRLQKRQRSLVGCMFR
jgi:hypothetical protein